jgi:DNA replication and repair protein RecF
MSETSFETSAPPQGETAMAVIARADAKASTRMLGVRRLTLTDFRSYDSLDLRINARLIVLTGDNGAGKTNVLEALSMLVPGRGLRRADLNDCIRKGGRGGFAVSAELETRLGGVQLGTGIELQANNAQPARKYRIDREAAPSIRAFCNYVRVVWLTPAMDGLFAGPPGDRRRFLDRLVLSIDADHATRVTAFERALRGRNRLLEEGTSADRCWLDAIEEEAAGLGIAIAAARIETVNRLSGLIQKTRDRESPFPWAELSVRGDVETLVKDCPALEAEEIYRSMLRASRTRDAAAKRASIGPQASDLCVRHGPKQIPAAQASTGEQKALLAGLVLAHARLVTALSGLAPLILLDEIAAHFDPVRRDALFRSVESLDGQIWFSGADRAMFAAIEKRALMLRAVPGLGIVIS